MVFLTSLALVSDVRTLNPRELAVHLREHAERRDVGCRVCHTKRPSLRFIPPLDEERIAGALEEEVRTQEAWDVVRRVARQDALRRRGQVE